MKIRGNILKSSENEWFSDLGSILNLDITIDMNGIYDQLMANREVKRESKHMVTTYEGEELEMQPAHQPNN